MVAEGCALEPSVLRPVILHYKKQKRERYKIVESMNVLPLLTQLNIVAAHCSALLQLLVLVGRALAC